MKKYVFTTVLAATMITAISASADPNYGGAAQTGARQFIAQPATSPKVIAAIRNGIPVSAHFRKRYDDLFTLCDTIDSEVVKLRSAAVLIGQERTKVAADMLLNGSANAKHPVKGLLQIAQDIGDDDTTADGQTVLPEMVVAVKASATLAQEFYVEIDDLVSQGKLLASVAAGEKYNFSRKLVEVILKTHREIDNDFYDREILAFSESCRFRECGFDDFPYDDDIHYDKIGEVVKDLLGAYQFAEAAMPSDHLNLSMAEQFADSAADMLNQSGFRRSYRGSIIRLLDAADVAESTKDGSDLEQVLAIPFVDSEIDSGKRHIRTYKLVPVEDGAEVDHREERRLDRDQE